MKRNELHHVTKKRSLISAQINRGIKEVEKTEVYSSLKECLASVTLLVCSLKVGCFSLSSFIVLQNIDYGNLDWQMTDPL